MSIGNQDDKKGSNKEPLDNSSDERENDDVSEKEFLEDDDDNELDKEEQESADADCDEEEDATSEETTPTYEELQSEVAALKDQLLRSLAEGENIRRRTEREKADQSKYAITNFAREIISVADNFPKWPPALLFTAIIPSAFKSCTFFAI